MDFGLSNDQREIQRTARELLAERARPERVREHAEAGRIDERLWRELCELGWPGIAVAERYGEQGLGRVELSILCEELGRAVAPVPLLPTVLAASEGIAELVVGAPSAGLVVLLEDDGARVLSSDEVEIEPCDSIDPTRPAGHVRAEAGAGEPLAGDVAGGIDRALVAVASEIVGVCDRALAMTVEYVKERKQFGVPVGSYQAVSHRCAQMLLDTEKARATTAFASWAADADPERLGEAAAMAKATASAIQAHGGIGFTWEADVHWLYKRALVDAALLGGAKRQRARLAEILV